VAARAFFRTRYAKIVIDAGLLRLGDEPDVEDGSEIDISAEARWMMRASATG